MSYKGWNKQWLCSKNPTMTTGILECDMYVSINITTTRMSFKVFKHAKEKGGE